MCDEIVTNIQLKKWKILETDLCSFCNKFIETTQHLLYRCDVTQWFWNEIENFIISECEPKDTLDMSEM